MAKVLYIVNWVPLLFGIFFFIYYIQFAQNELVSFDEWVFEKQVNYAADSAIEELLESGDLDTDYASDYIRIDPDIGVRNYAEVIASNLGYVPNQQMVDMICNDYIQALVICGYDGMYAYWNTQSDNTGATSFQATPKIPYFYYDNDGNLYTLTLGNEVTYKTDHVDGKVTKYPKFKDLQNAGGPSKAQQKTAINNQVAEVLNYAIEQAYVNGGTMEQFSMPAFASEVSGSQPVNGPTILGVVKGKSLSSQTEVTAESIGGARIKDTDYVVGLCYDFGSGGNYHVYAKSSWLKKYMDHEDAVGLPPGSLRNALGEKHYYFDSVYDAATGKNAAGQYVADGLRYSDLIAHINSE